MAIRIERSAGLQTALNSVIAAGSRRFTLGFRLKVVTPPDFPGGNIACNVVVKGLSLYFTFLSASAGSQAPQFLVRCMTAGGVSSAPVALNANMSNAIVITYDADDPAGQALYANTVRRPITPAMGQPLIVKNTPLSIGNVSDDPKNAAVFEVEDVFYADGVAMSGEQVFRHAEGADVAELTAGAAARWRWTLEGTPGAVPVAGDPGLVEAFGSGLDLKPFVGVNNAGSRLAYAEPIPFVSAVAFDTPRVCSSGEAILVRARLATTGAPLLLADGSIVDLPTIRVDGGDPIALAWAHYSGQHYGVVFLLPPGVAIPKGAAVTMTAPDRWFGTAVGMAKGFVDLPIVNRSGDFLFTDVVDPIFDVGENVSGPMERYWGAERIMANCMHRMNVDDSSPSAPSLREDGTLRSNWRGLLYDASTRNPVDATGTPIPLGKWYVRYKVKDADTPQPTSISLIPGVPGPIVERLDLGYASPDGYRTRIFEVGRDAASYTLQAPCGPADVELTLDRTAGLSPKNSAGVPTQWIEVGGEYMDVLSFTASTRKVKVARDVFGTGAGSHDAGSTATASRYNAYPTIYVDVRAGSGEPNYEDLVILPPGEWDEPDTPGPVTLSPTERQRSGISRALAESLASGAGIVRTMDLGPVFTQVSEPEDMRLDSDVYPGSTYKTSRSWTQASARPMDPATCRGFYYERKVPGAVQYAATLGVDVTTAPAPGTVEWITIPDAATAPVFAHRRLYFPSGEILRVLDAVGDQVQVVRGAGGTTPKPQAAGPILVGWRVPHTSASQYDRPNSAAVEILTVEPHKLVSGTWASTPSVTDLNPTARIAVTLTTPVTTPTQTVFAVSVADADAAYLAQGLHVVWDDEEVRVLSVDRASGTTTIKTARGMGGTRAAVHAAGAVGRGRSNSVFCVSADGTQHAWHDQAGYTYDYQVTGPNSLMTAYYVPFGGQAGRLSGEQAFDVTPVPGPGGVDQIRLSFQVPKASASYEQTARIAALSPGSTYWASVPLLATDDYIDAQARAVRDTLPAGKHRVAVELANEIWNFPGFPFIGPITKASMIQGLAADIDSWLLDGRRACDRFRAVFAEQGRGDEVEFVVAYQTGNLEYALGRARALGVDVDVVSTAPYHSPDATPVHVATWSRASDAQCLDLWLAELLLYTKGAGGALEQDGAARRRHEAATGRPVRFLHYECGPESLTPRPTSLIPDGDARNMDVFHDPNFVYVQHDFMYAAYLRGGSDGGAFYTHCRPPAGPLAFGPGTFWAYWGMRISNVQKAGWGDGRDGTPDNRSCLATPGKPASKHPTVNKAANCVSTRLQGFLLYNERRRAFLNPPPPPPPPPDPTPATHEVSAAIGFTTSPGGPQVMGLAAPGPLPSPVLTPREDGTYLIKTEAPLGTTTYLTVADADGKVLVLIPLA